MPSNHLILCCSLLLPLIFPSIGLFSSELALHIRWPKYWSFNFSTSPSNKYLELISFRIDWFDLLAVQGTLKSLLQLSVSYLFAFSSYSWRSQGKNTEVVCHSFLPVNHIHRFFFLNGKILLLSILLLTQVRMPNAPGSQTNWNVKSWGQQKVYCWPMQGNRVAHDLKSLELPGSVWAALLKKAGWGKRVTESGISLCTVLWWWRGAKWCHRVNFISPWTPGGQGYVLRVVK